MALVPMCCPVPGNTHRKASGSQIYWEYAEQWNAACATGRVASWSVGCSAHTLHRFLRLKCGISTLAKHSSLGEGQSPKMCYAWEPQGVCCLAQRFCRPCCKVLCVRWEKDAQCLTCTGRFLCQAGIAATGDAEFVLLCGIDPFMGKFPIWTGIHGFTITGMPNKNAVNINKDYESFRFYTE